MASKTDVTVQPWSPATPPAPSPDVNLTQLDYLLREVTRLRATVDGLTTAAIQGTDVAPQTTLNGLLRYASGDWATQLGGGAGIYAYQNGVWTKLLAPGHVSMMRLSDSTSNLSTHAVWIVIKPDGSILDISGTTTQGLQEGITYAQTYGYDMITHGGMVKPASSFGAYDGQDPSIIDCSTGITLLPMEFCRIIISGATINFHASVGAGFTFDSFIDCYVELCRGGQIVMGGANAIGVKFAPVNQVPEDSAFGIGIGGANTVFIGPVTVPTGGTGQCIQFDTTNGPIQQGNHFIFPELLGGNIGINLNVGAHGFTGNVIEGRFIHGQDAQCVRLGINTTNSTFYGGNKWFLHMEPLSTGIGFDSWASGASDYILATAVGNTSPVAIKLESSTANHIVELVRADGFTTQFTDTGTGNLIIGLAGRLRLPYYTVANLPAASAINKGCRLNVTDATVTTFASIVAGGGANFVPVYSDGTNWRIG